MHLVIIVLTAAVIALIVWQLASKKGTEWHAFRGLLITGSAVSLVVLVVILSVRQGVHWSGLLILHLVLGTGFFIALFRTSWLGYRNRRRYLKDGLFTPYLLRDMGNHRWWARATTTLLVLTLVSAFIASNSRRAAQKQVAIKVAKVP